MPSPVALVTDVLALQAGLKRAASGANRLGQRAELDDVAGREEAAVSAERAISTPSTMADMT
jgi:hypothetical protein